MSRHRSHFCHYTAWCGEMEYDTHTSDSSPPCSPPAPACARRTVGLTNAGSTCYANAWLQAMGATGAYERACRLGRGTAAADDPVVRALCRLVQSSCDRDPHDDPNDPSDAAELARAMDRASSEFPAGAQADTHAFGMMATERMLRWSARTPQTFEAREDPISARLRLTLRHETRCTSCGATSAEVAPAWDLPVPVPRSARTLDLGACVAAALEPRAAAVCARCGRTAAHKRIAIARHPRYLILHLMRFDHRGRKLFTRVSVARRGVRVCGRLYDCVATIAHRGSETSGHYVASVRQADGGWVRADDASVRRISRREALGDDLYIVVLRQRLSCD